MEQLNLVMDYLDEHDISINKVMNSIVIFVALLLVFYYLYTIYDAVRNMLAHEEKSRSVLEEESKTRPEEVNKDKEASSSNKREE